eukprot:s5925_g1.t1
MDASANKAERAAIAETIQMKGKAAEKRKHEKAEEERKKKQQEADGQEDPDEYAETGEEDAEMEGQKNGQRMQRLKTQLLLLSATDPRPL